MSKEQTKDLLKFLKPFGADITELVMWLRDLAWELCPQANKLIYDNYNAVAFGWSPTHKVGHTICSIAVRRSSNNIHFGFYWEAYANSLSKVKDEKQIIHGRTIFKSVSQEKRTGKKKKEANSKK
jgi:hypothetical protein